jgi:hypothetical protein
MSRSLSRQVSRLFAVKPLRHRGSASRATRRRELWAPEGLEARVLLSGIPTSYTVNLLSDTGISSGTDSSTGDPSGDLLWAIEQANANANTAGSVIGFDPTLFATTQIITLTSTLELSETAGPEVIDGPGATLVTVSGGGAVRDFQVNGGVTATLSGLTISRGSATLGGGVDISEGGGLTVSESTIEDNTAILGGGIRDSGLLRIIDNSLISDNLADSGAGGGVSAVSGAVVSATNSTISDNNASEGGGIYVTDGALTINQSRVSGNTAADFGGAIFGGVGGGTIKITNGSIISNNVGAGGGGIFDVLGFTGITVSGSTISDNTGETGGGIFASGGTVTIDDESTISGNTGGNEGGGILSDGTLVVMNSTIGGTVAGDGNQAGLGGGICANGTVTISDSTIAGNAGIPIGNSAGEAGGIVSTSQLTVTDSTISENSADYGGAILNFGTAMIGDCTISGDTASARGGGIDNAGTLTVNDGSTISGNTTGDYGGGVCNEGILTVTGGSTISDNSATFGGGGIADTTGSGTVMINDSTISDNTVKYGDGGGIDFAGSGSMTITGGTISGNSARAGGGISDDTSAIATVSGSTISDNTATFYNGGGIDNIGSGPVTVTGGTISGNRAYHGGGIFNGAGSKAILGGGCDLVKNGATFGGGVANDGTLTADDCTFATNSASTGGGIYNSSGSASVSSCTISNNQAGDGGGIFVDVGAVTLTKSTVSDNTALYDGGGSYDEGTLIVADGSTLSDNSAGIEGGGIYGDATDTIAITITQSSVLDNSAGDDGGGIYDLSLTSHAVLTIDDSTLSGNSGSSNTYGGGICGSGTISITDNSVISHNSGRYGGGIYSIDSLTVSNSTVANNTGVYAGGIEDFGTATITDSVLSGNTGNGIDNAGTLTVSDGTLTGNVGPAIENFATLKVTDSTFSDNSAGDGGAVSNVSGGSASISSCTISGNSANYGGGIFIGSGTVTLTNSTVAGNTVIDGGGGIYGVSGTLKAVNSTIAYNEVSDPGSGGGIYDATGDGTILYNTIVALNTDGTGAGATADDIAGAAVSSSSADNLVGADETGSLTNDTNGNQVGVTDPALGALASNGGPTQTIALLAGSPAIDAGSNALSVDPQGNPLLYDQRGPGYARIVNGTVDIGAFEVAGAQIMPTVSVNPVNLTYGTALENSQLSGTATAIVGNNPVNVPGTFTYTTADGTVLGAGDDQTESVTFTPTDSTDYSTVVTSVIVNVAQAAPEVFVEAVDLTYGTALENSQLSGTVIWTVGSSLVNVPGSFSYTSAAGTVLNAGDGQTESVTFTPTDSTDYTTVPTSVIVNVAQAMPAVTVEPVNLTYGTALENSQLGGPAYWIVNSDFVNVPGSFTYTSAAGTVLGAGDFQIESVTFTPDDSIDYTTVPTSVIVDVAKAAPVVSVNSVYLPYGTALENSQLSGTASWTVGGDLVNVPGSFGYTSAAGTVPPIGITTEAVTFTPTDSTDYTTVPTTVTVTVVVPISITLTSSANIPVPGQPVTLTATVTPADDFYGTPSRTVTFDENGAPWTQVNLTDGVARVTTSFAAGSYAFTASYNPNIQFAGATSNTVYELAEPYSATQRGTDPNSNAVLDYDRSDLAVDAQGDIYGTSYGGGTDGDGSVFEIVKGTNSITTLASFDGDNGWGPEGNLVLDAQGNLYGMTFRSQNTPDDGGTVFELAHGSQTITTLADLPSFDPQASDGVVMDAQGNLYGELYNQYFPDGINSYTADTVFEIVKASGQFETLATFDSTERPAGGLVVDAQDNVYGTTNNGGGPDGTYPTVFEIVNGSNSITTLASFNSSYGPNTTGFYGPQGNLVMDAQGNLYGATDEGGVYGDGSVFEFVKGSDSVTTLASLDGNNGMNPEGGVTMDAQGNLYGTTSLGGTDGLGTVFGLFNGTGTIVPILTFDGTNGAKPSGSLAIDDQGNLYGTAGNTDDLGGSVFEISRAVTNDYVNAAWSGPDYSTAEPVKWTDGTTHYIGYDAFSTVQEGVNAALYGGIVNIAAGTYTGQVTISRNVSLEGSDPSATDATTMIQAPANLVGDEIAIASGVSASFGLLGVNAGTGSVNGIDVDGGTLDAGGLVITGCNVGILVQNSGTLGTNSDTIDDNSDGILVENDSNATITFSTFSDNATGILVGSSSADESSLTATNDSFAGDTVGVQDRQKGTQMNATFDWWGTASGPANASNPGGAGPSVVGIVTFSPWLGDENLFNPDNLIFLSLKGNQYDVTPNSGLTGLNITLGGQTVAQVLANVSLAFTGNGGTVTIEGEPYINDVFAVTDTSVQYQAADGLSGDTITFLRSGITRDVIAQGNNNTFDIQGTGTAGPYNLVGGSYTNSYVFSGSSGLLGNIEGGGSSTLSYAAYGTGAAVNLANGTNGTATGLSGNVRGITAIIGSPFNDTLNAGTVKNVLLTGGPGVNSLSGTGTGDTVVESSSTSMTLSNAAITGTGFTDNLSGITVAQLTDTGGGNTFTVSGWTGRGSLTAPVADPDTVVASKSASYTLTNTSLASTDGMSLTWNSGGITTADLTDTAGGNTFTVTGWTQGGLLTDSASTADTVVAKKAASYTLSNTSLSSSDGMSLGLSGITASNLTATGSGRTFTVTGWTGTGTLTGSSATVVDSVSADVGLGNSLLAVIEGALLNLSGITTANLTDTAGGNTFTVGGWTHGGSLTDSSAVADTVAASKNANVTLTNTTLATTDGMSLGLNGITNADLTDTAGGHTFTLNGWTGGGYLIDSASTASILAAAENASFTLSNNSVMIGTQTIGLIGRITTARLTDTGGGNTFTVSGWTGSGTLNAPVADPDTVAATKTASFTLTNTSLSSTDGMSLTWNNGGITTANLTDTGGGNTFTVSGWTHGGSLTDSSSTADTIVAKKAASYTLSNTSLASTDGMSLGLSGFATANLTATGSGRSFTVTGWTGTGTLTGSSATVVASVSNSLELENSLLGVLGGAYLNLSGITGADLTDTVGGNLFVVSGWTHLGSLTDSSSVPDEVLSSQAANVTLSNTLLSSTDGLVLVLSGITYASLTDTAGGHTFTLNGWTGSGQLTDAGSAASILVADEDASVTLSNSAVTIGTQTIGLSGPITTAELSDTGGGNTFTVSGWTGKGSLTAAVSGPDTVAASKSAGYTLTNTALSSTDGMSLTLDSGGFTTANLTDTGGGNTFTVSGWTYGGSLTDSSSTADTVVAKKAASYTLSNTSLATTDGMLLGLSNVTTANLTDTGSGHTFTVTGWTGNGSLTGHSDAVTATESSNTTLTNSELTASPMSLGLSGINAANLTVTASSGHPAYILDASAFSKGPANLTASGTVNAIVYGGTFGQDTLTVAAGGGGNNILIGNGADDTLTDNGSGYNILIGAGAGGDTITGNGNDILISGTTSYDSDTSANIAALDAILAEWTSSDSYMTRINKIMSGVGSGSYAFNASTITPDRNLNTLSDGGSQPANTNWFLASSRDTVNKNSNEIETTN